MGKNKLSLKDSTKFELMEQYFFDQFSNDINEEVNESLIKDKVMNDVFEENLKEGKRLSDFQSKGRLKGAHHVTLEMVEARKMRGLPCDTMDREHAFRMMMSGPSYGGRAGKLLEDIALSNIKSMFKDNKNLKSIQGQVAKPGFGQNFDAYVERNDGAWIGIMIQRDMHHGGAQSNRGIAYAKKSISLEGPNKMLMLVSNAPATYSRGHGKNTWYNAFAEQDAYKNLVWMSGMLEQISEFLNK